MSLYVFDVLLLLTVIEDSVTLRSSDFALLKLAKVGLGSLGTERPFPASSDISYKYRIRNWNSFNGIKYGEYI